MREHLKVISPHSPGDNRIGTNNKHSMRLLRDLKKATVVWRLVIDSVKREK